MRSTHGAAALAAAIAIGAPAVAGAATHTVKPGESLSVIADKYGTTVAALAQRNGIKNVDLVVVGQTLDVGTATSPAAPSTPATYTVKSGDSLAAIAIQLGVSMTELARVNGIANPDLIWVGSVLTVPGAGATGGGTTSSGGGGGGGTVPTSGGAEYIVRDGDTLSSIAVSYGFSMTALAEKNGIVNSNMIFVGQRLALPVDASLPVGLFGKSATAPAKLALVPMFNRWADANGIPRDLVKAVAYHESGWNNSAISSVGAIGIGQLMPETAKFISQELIGVSLDPYIPEHNIRMSARFLRYLLEQTNGDVRQALAGYYQGLASVRSRGWFDDTKQYVANIEALRGWF